MVNAAILVSKVQYTAHIALLVGIVQYIAHIFIFIVGMNEPFRDGIARCGTEYSSVSYRTSAQPARLGRSSRRQSPYHCCFGNRSSQYQSGQA
ncbi:conserved hypothetical protein [Acinetobacter proteolyticus]|uniref:Uncharacterized protein n=1 Tax=Acinetobacter proteolyticus TaxID=1776741 RepID=A0A653K6W5_9GAMM|nr:conserved hypothetical protein [Acinetobacter proteolyticus]